MKGSLMTIRNVIFGMAVALCTVTAQATLIEATDIQSTINSTPYVVVDLYQPGCPPCNHMNPIFAAAANALNGIVTFVKVNIRTSSLGTQLGIRGTPTFVYYKNGSEVHRHAGNLNRQTGNTWDASSFTSYVKQIFGL